MLLSLLLLGVGVDGVGRSVGGWSKSEGAFDSLSMQGSSVSFMDNEDDRINNAYTPFDNNNNNYDNTMGEGMNEGVYTPFESTEKLASDL